MDNPSAKIRVLLVDDHPAVRKSLRSALEGHSDIEVIGEAMMARRPLLLWNTFGRQSS